MMEQSAKTGSITVAAAAAVNVVLGWTPRYVRAVNIDNLTIHEFFEGMTAGTSLDTVNHDDTQLAVNAADAISTYAGREAGAAVSGTAAVTADSTAVTGTSTNFSGELAVGDVITINGETRTIAAIKDDDEMTVDVAFDNTAAGAHIFDMVGKGAGFSLGTDICADAADVVRWLAIR